MPGNRFAFQAEDAHVFTYTQFDLASLSPWGLRAMVETAHNKHQKVVALSAITEIVLRAYGDVDGQYAASWPALPQGERERALAAATEFMEIRPASSASLVAWPALTTALSRIIIEVGDKPIDWSRAWRGGMPKRTFQELIGTLSAPLQQAAIARGMTIRWPGSPPTAAGPGGMIKASWGGGSRFRETDAGVRIEEAGSYVVAVTILTDDVHPSPMDPEQLCAALLGNATRTLSDGTSVQLEASYRARGPATYGALSDVCLNWLVTAICSR